MEVDPLKANNFRQSFHASNVESKGYTLLSLPDEVIRSIYRNLINYYIFSEEDKQKTFSCLSEVNLRLRRIYIELISRYNLKAKHIDRLSIERSCHRLKKCERKPCILTRLLNLLSYGNCTHLVIRNRCCMNASIAAYEVLHKNVNSLQVLDLIEADKNLQYGEHHSLVKKSYIHFSQMSHLHSIMISPTNRALESIMNLRVNLKEISLILKTRSQSINFQHFLLSRSHHLRRIAVDLSFVTGYCSNENELFQKSQYYVEYCLPARKHENMYNVNEQFLSNDGNIFLLNELVINLMIMSVEINQIDLSLVSYTRKSIRKGENCPYCRDRSSNLNRDIWSVNENYLETSSNVSTCVDGDFTVVTRRNNNIRDVDNRIQEAIIPKDVAPDVSCYFSKVEHLDHHTEFVPSRYASASASSEFLPCFLNAYFEWMIKQTELRDITKKSNRELFKYAKSLFSGIQSISLIKRSPEYYSDMDVRVKLFLWYNIFPQGGRGDQESDDTDYDDTCHVSSEADERISSKSVSSYLSCSDLDYNSVNTDIDSFSNNQSGTDADNSDEEIEEMSENVSELILGAGNHSEVSTNETDNEGENSGGSTSNEDFEVGEVNGEGGMGGEHDHAVAGVDVVNNLEEDSSDEDVNANIGHHGYPMQGSNGAEVNNSNLDGDIANEGDKEEEEDEDFNESDYATDTGDEEELYPDNYQYRNDDEEDARYETQSEYEFYALQYHRDSPSETSTKRRKMVKKWLKMINVILKPSLESFRIQSFANHLSNDLDSSNQLGYLNFMLMNATNLKRLDICENALCRFQTEGLLNGVLKSLSSLHCLHVYTPPVDNHTDKYAAVNLQHFVLNLKKIIRSVHVHCRTLKVWLWHCNEEHRLIDLDVRHKGMEQVHLRTIIDELDIMRVKHPNLDHSSIRYRIQRYLLD